MEAVRFNTSCIGCILNKFLKMVPSGTEETERLQFAKGILRIISDADTSESAPEIVADCTRYKNEFFGFSDDFAELKTYFNKLMLGLEKDVSEKISASSDSLRSAICYALLGNYIDFGAMDSVDEERLRTLIDVAEDIGIDICEVEKLRTELKAARTLVYLTDNCGEIVFDKLLIKEIKKQFPELSLTVLVRGENVLNDATLKDACDVGLTEIADVLPNGTGIAGTVPSRLPKELQMLISNADIIISKGQGNFETLCYGGRNVYYLFMCKCKMFAERFNVAPLTPMLINDRRMERR